MPGGVACKSWPAGQRIGIRAERSGWHAPDPASAAAGVDQRQPCHVPRRRVQEHRYHAGL